MNYKHIILFFSLIFIFSCESKASNEDTVESTINQFINTVEQNKENYTQKTSEYMGKSSQGGEVIAYYEGVTLKYIEAVVMGEMGKVLYDCYFYLPNKICIIETVIVYDMPIQMPNASIAKKEKTKIIISGDNQWKVDDNFVKLSTKLSDNYIIIVKSFIEAIKKVKRE
jgi:hypothetical protein